MPKFQPKIMFHAVLNWKSIQFSESHQFWWIWKKMFVFKISLVIDKCGVWSILRGKISKAFYRASWSLFFWAKWSVWYLVGSFTFLYKKIIGIKQKARSFYFIISEHWISTFRISYQVKRVLVCSLGGLSHFGDVRFAEADLSRAFRGRHFLGIRMTNINYFVR
jgi:hypothetical protein